jgi:hypothetical protein
MHSTRRLMLIADETKTVNQALGGIGCRPSPSFVALALNRIGFRYIYSPIIVPDHPDLRFEWRDSMESSRDGHNLRCVFVATRRALASVVLNSLLT